MLCHAVLCCAMLSKQSLNPGALACNSKPASRCGVSFDPASLTLQSCYCAEIIQGKRATQVAVVLCMLTHTSITQSGIVKLKVNKQCSSGSPTSTSAAPPSLRLVSITLLLGWVRVETVPHDTCIQCSVACCMAVHILASVLHGTCQCIRCECTATPDTAVVTVMSAWCHRCTRTDTQSSPSAPWGLCREWVPGLGSAPP